MAEPAALSWRDVARPVRRHAYTEAKLGRAVAEPQLAAAAAAWAVARTRHLSRAIVAVATLWFVSGGLATLIAFKVMPPLLHLQPGHETVRDAASRLLFFVAWVAFGAWLLIDRLRARARRLGAANSTSALNPTAASSR